MAVEFRVLGDVAAHIDGHPVDVGHLRQQCVLAHAPGRRTIRYRPISCSTGSGASGLPQRARGTLHSYLSRLRQVLAPATDVAIVRRSGGYVLTVDPMAVDLFRFRHLVAQARTAADDEHAADLLAQALGLWRGEAFGTLDTPWLNAFARDLRPAAARGPSWTATTSRCAGASTPTCWCELSGAAADEPLGRTPGRAADARPVPVRSPGRGAWSSTSGCGGAWPTSWAPTPARRCAGCTSRSSPPTRPWPRHRSIPRPPRSSGRPRQSRGADISTGAAAADVPATARVPGLVHRPGHRTGRARARPWHRPGPPPW